MKRFFNSNNCLLMTRMGERGESGEARAKSGSEEKRMEQNCAPLCQLMALIIFSEFHVISRMSCCQMPGLILCEGPEEEERKEKYSLSPTFCPFSASDGFLLCLLSLLFLFLILSVLYFLVTLFSPSSLLFTYDCSEEWEHQSKRTTSFSPFYFAVSLTLVAAGLNEK